MRIERAQEMRSRGWLNLPVALLLSCLAVAGLASGAQTGALSATSPLADLSLEDLMQIETPTVYGASKFEQKTTEAPSSVTVVTAEEIRRFGYRTLADVLQSVHGFYVSYDRSTTFLGTRGINLGDFNSRVLVLVDGHRINNNLTDGAAIGTDFIVDVDLIDRVEIVRGPGSVLYGNNAFFGIVNVITRSGDQLKGAEVAGDYGSFNSYKGRVTYGNSLTNGLQWILSGSVYHSDGAHELYFEEYDTPAQNNGIAENADADSSVSLYGSVSLHGFTLDGAFLERQKENPTAQYFTTFNDDRLETKDLRAYASLKYEHEFEQVGDLTARVYYDQANLDLTYPYSSGTFKEKAEGQWWGAEAQLTKHLWSRHVATLGAEYRDDFQQSRTVYNADTGQTTTPEIKQSRRSYGVFGQADVAALTNLHFIGGIRYDQYGQFDPDLNPRLAAIYSPFRNTTFKLLYGTAFRVPNFLELSDPRFQDIAPEEISTYEIVYEQGIGSHLRSSISGFINEIDDLILLSSGTYTNMDARTRGVEVALRGYWIGGLQSRVSYSFQDTENLTTGNGFADSPAHLVKFNLSVPLYQEKIRLGLEYLYTSSRTTLWSDPSFVPAQTVSGEDVGGFGVVNLTLFSQDVVKGLQFSASVYNLLDTRYSDPSSRYHLQDSLPRDGRTFRVRLTYKF